MAHHPRIQPKDGRLTFLDRFCREENIARSTIYRFKDADPAFPTPRFGKRYWRPDLLAYMYKAIT